MSQRRKITRREFLSLSAAAAAGAVVSACAPADTATPAPPEPTTPPEPTDAPEPTDVPEPEDTPVPADTPVPPSMYNEAPMLAAMVEAGNLPPVDERLPKNPWVYPPNDGIGNYGGVMRRGFKGVSDAWGCRKFIDRKLVTWSPDLQLIPRLCESWELSADAKTWTWHLREGTKWSDGVDFTTADYMYHYENFYLNEELNPTFPTGRSTKGPDGEWNPVVYEAPDDYTLVMKFADPNPLFIFSTYRDYREPHCSHFMKQFHMDLTDDKAALEQMIADEGLESWMDVYNNRWEMGLSNGEASPSTYPWNAVNTMRDEVFLMERNPYFYGVDPEGNQLPYLDNIQFRLFDSAEVFNLRCVGGEVDFQARHLSMANYTLLKENESGGDYHVMLGKKSSHVAMQVNHTCQDPNLREFFQNRNARIAMSLAANRQEINELVFSGQYTPRQYSPLEASPDYYPKLSNAYIEYDPDTANDLLDAEGYTDRDAEGYRMFKDGSGPISFVIESTMGVADVAEDAVNMYIGYLKDIGIKAQLLIEERSLYTEHFQANDIEAAWWGGDRTVVPLAAPIIFIGTQPDRPWCPAWGYWRGDPTNPVAEEPPEGHFIYEIWRIWDEEIAVESDEAKQHEAFRKILDIWAEELPYIGLLGEQPGPCVVKNGFRGYVEGYPIDDVTSDEHLLQTETYYWENPEEHSL
jgi:peptide/nickel transport system substrate-binding protein